MREETLNLDLKGLESFCEDVSLKLKVGDIICLFGELGSGKTTVVRNLINSIYKKRSSFITIAEKTAAIDGIRFKCNSGTFSKATFRLYGITNG